MKNLSIVWNIYIMVKRVLFDEGLVFDIKIKNTSQ